jgi:hypothetical protein
MVWLQFLTLTGSYLSLVKETIHFIQLALKIDADTAYITLRVLL